MPINAPRLNIAYRYYLAEALVLQGFCGFFNEYHYTLEEWAEISEIALFINDLTIFIQMYRTKMGRNYHRGALRMPAKETGGILGFWVLCSGRD